MRGIYFCAGTALVGLGILGAILPVMPSTIFFILALPCLTRSSPALENWLLEHRAFGPTLRAWKRDKAIATRTKVVAISMLTVSILVSALFFVHTAWLRWLLIAIAVCVSVYIATRNSTPAERTY